MCKLMMTNVGDQIQLDNNDGTQTSIHRIAIENVFGPYIRLLESKLEQAGDVLACITLPLFPTQQRPFSSRSLELFKQYLYLTVITRKDDISDVTLLELLELALIAQFLDPGCDLEKEALKLLSHKLTLTIVYNDFTELWDTAIGLHCLGLLVTKAQFILPLLSLHNDCGEVSLFKGMVGDVHQIIEPYTKKIASFLPPVALK